jgi:hypothetical protein
MANRQDVDLRFAQVSALSTSVRPGPARRGQARPGSDRLGPARPGSAPIPDTGEGFGTVLILSAQSSVGHEW